MLSRLAASLHYRSGHNANIDHNNDSFSSSGGDGMSCSIFDDEASTSMSPNQPEKQSGANKAQEEAADDEALARPETLAVRILRVLVLLVMVGAAVTVSLFVYFYMKQTQETALEDNFYDLSNRLVEGFHANTKLRFQTLDMLSIVCTSAAMETHQNWPYVTLADFEAIGTAARTIVGSDYIGLYPYVTDDTKKTWENYTTHNTAWLHESYTYQEDFKSNHNNRTVGVRAPARSLREDLREMEMDRWLVEETNAEEEVDVSTDDAVTSSSAINATFDGPDGITTELYRYGTDEEGFLFVVEDSPGPYYPMWQVTPAREYAALDINYNIADPFYNPAFSAASEAVRTTHTAIFGGVWNVDDTGYIDENDDYDFRTVPAASLFYPVFDTILGGSDRNVIAVMDMDVEFGSLFTSVLPSNSNKLICVVRNTCGQTFSYEIEGDVATYLGAEDLHDPEHAHFMVEALLTDFEGAAGIYNGAPINQDFCPWVLSVYGTQELQDAHINNEPIYYMCAVFGIFLFTLFSFLLYDCLVEHRQRKVVKTAQKTEKIVSSLFPKAFRDKMYAENKQKEKLQQQRNNANNTFLNQTLAFSSHHPTKQNPPPAQEAHPEQQGEGQPVISAAGSSIANSPPMAELYPNCTVFFADIAGFTAWSSSRCPVDVFQLLETLYGAFDKMAKRHKVFKIETIGDCYVAVTGLPMPQPHHAVLMVKFARDCLAKMGKLTRQLEGTLGPDTGGLALRVGLHSGPVTAGVLRGEKARFQLFGDTVNTAARMESNGQPSRIHVSQQTADILIEMGKGHWVDPREGLVHCKGKGDLQTYFVKETSGTGSVVSARSASEASSTLDDEDVFEVEMALADMHGTEDEKLDWADNNYRRVRWVTDLLKEELKKIASVRGTVRGDFKVWYEETLLTSDNFSWNEDMSRALLSGGDSGLNEGILSTELQQQLMEFVAQVAYSCQGAVFNFEQSCHALMSVDRMLKQIPDAFGSASQLSPLAKFACLFATLVRNLSPPETPRISRQGEECVLCPPSAAKSTAAGKALKLLQDDRLRGVQQAICTDSAEFQRFWSIVQNFILATDVSQGVLSEERGDRWDVIFASAETSASPHQKAIAILEHIMLLAEEGHAVQHWETYAKWSTLWKEEFKAERQNEHPEEDLELFWHQAQLHYFDTFMLPISQKIDQAGVLGSIGSEFSTYASQNRRELDSVGFLKGATASLCVAPDIRSALVKRMSERQPAAPLLRTVTTERKPAASSLLASTVAEETKPTTLALPALTADDGFENIVDV